MFTSAQSGPCWGWVLSGAKTENWHCPLVTLCSGERSAVKMVAWLVSGLCFWQFFTLSRAEYFQDFEMKKKTCSFDLVCNSFCISFWHNHEMDKKVPVQVDKIKHPVWSSYKSRRRQVISHPVSTLLALYVSVSLLPLSLKVLHLVKLDQGLTGWDLQTQMAHMFWKNLRAGSTDTHFRRIVFSWHWDAIVEEQVKHFITF